uniref:RING-type E3 ubiquitin transferase n=1 Tax=Elaeophora elaphi TaxID=1147741 RepID=A0A0R3RFX8_9BILA
LNIFQLFSSKKLPINLVCGHTICYDCLKELHTNSCPLDQAVISIPFEKLPPNLALLSVLSECNNNKPEICQELSEEYRHIESILVQLASYLHPVECLFGGSVWSDELSRPMQRKLVSLLCYQLVEYKGLQRALKTARALAERALSELIIYHQDNSNVSATLWSAVRARGCQFLGPAMQEEVLKLILLILSEGALMSRKTLVLYIVQTLREDYPQASKTCIGHVVQLLYRAGCFNVLKREGESSLMQLKAQFSDYDALRREHDTQIVQVAFEQGLRISPDQWSTLLYGDQHHRSHMQSIIDKVSYLDFKNYFSLQSVQNFEQQINDLKAAVESSSDREMLTPTFEHFERFANFDYSNELSDWTLAVDLFDSLLFIVKTYAQFMRTRSLDKFVPTTKYVRPSMCRQRDRNYKTHFSRNFSNLGDISSNYVYPTDVQCTYTLTKNGLHASTPQIHSHHRPVVVDQIPAEAASSTTVSRLQMAELPPLLTNASPVDSLSAVGNSSFTGAKKSSVNLVQKLIPPIQPLRTPPITLLPLMIPAVNYPISSPSLPATALMQIAVPGSASLPVGVTPIFPVPSSSLQISPARFGRISGSDDVSDKVCSVQYKIPMEPRDLSRLESDVHRVRHSSYVQNGCTPKNNVMDSEQLVLRRRLQFPHHAKGTGTDINTDEDDLQSCKCFRNNSAKLAPVATTIPIVCSVLSRISNTIPASSQAPCTIAHIRDTIKQPLRTPCVQQSQ